MCQNHAQKTRREHKDLCKVKEQVTVPITSMLGARANPARIEIKLCSFIAEKNLPISLVEELVPLLQDLFPSDPALRQVKLGKQKSTNIIRQVFGFHAMKERVSKLRENKFSLIIDETTDLLRHSWQSSEFTSMKKRLNLKLL